MSAGPIATIKASVAEHYGFRVGDLISARKTRDVTRARHIAMWLCNRLTTRSATEIGRHFGNRDRKTVTNAWERIEERMAAYPVLKAEVEALAVTIAASAGASSAGYGELRGRALAMLDQARLVECEVARLRTMAIAMLAAAETGGPAVEAEASPPG